MLLPETHAATGVAVGGGGGEGGGVEFTCCEAGVVVGPIGVTVKVTVCGPLSVATVVVVVDAVVNSCDAAVEFKSDADVELPLLLVLLVVDCVV